MPNSRQLFLYVSLAKIIMGKEGNYIELPANVDRRNLTGFLNAYLPFKLFVILRLERNLHL